MRKAILISACLMMLVGIIFSSCQSQTDLDQKLRIALNTDPTTLDPRKATDLNAHNIIRLLYDGLTRLGPDGTITHSLARHHQISKDGKTYTFYLKDAQWSDGKKVTAYDFEHTWKQSLSPNFPSGECFKLFVLKNAKEAKEGKISTNEVGVKALNNETLLVELESPIPYFLELTAQTAFYAVPKDTPIGSHIHSNGPFQLVSWEHNHQLIFKKNPFYWDYCHLGLDEIEISIIPNETTALSMYEEGDLDWIGQPFTALPIDAIETLRNSWNLHQQAISATCWLVFNTKEYPFNNENLRKAFSFAINRKSLSEDVMNHEHLPAYSPIPTMGNFAASMYYNDDMQSKASSYLDKALQELGIEKDKLEVTFRYNSSELNHRIAQALQNQWLENLGLPVKLEQNEWKVHLSKLKAHDFQIARTAWFADYSDPTAFLDIFRYSENQTNYPRWENASFKDLLNQSANNRNLVERMRVLKEAEGICSNEMPVAPLYYYTYTYACSDLLKKYVVSSIGEVDFKWAYFEETEGD